MKKLKKLMALGLSLATVLTLVTGCGGDTGGETQAPGTEDSKVETTAPAQADTEAVPDEAAGEGKVYYLNFKPEQAEQWEELAAVYQEETGIKTTVVTAASGTYESTLKSEIAKTEAPTLFQVNGPVGLASWKDYCYDLKDSDVYSNLKSDDFALIGDSGEVSGIAYVIETYGLIYNKALLADYCALDGAVIQSADEITNFETLKAVA